MASSSDAVHVDVIDIEDPYKTQEKTLKLYDYHEVPYFLRGNVFITDGYRAYLSYKWCWKRSD